MSNVTMAGPLAALHGSGSLVYFSKSNTNAGVFQPVKGTALRVRKMQNSLNVAFWGEDNRFPQNVEQQLAYVGIAKSALAFKAAALYGGGIVPGKIIGQNEKTNEDVFQPLDRTKYKVVYDFLEGRQMPRFFMEYFQDWVWYANCFPELIFSKDAKSFTGMVHQESCDCRFEQMSDDGVIKKVFLSKLWGMGPDQYAKFDKDKKLKVMLDGGSADLLTRDSKFLKTLDSVDMYNSLASAKAIALGLRNTKGLGKFKSCILPVNYPSPNKTYYQVAYWDGARLSGWFEIAAKIPNLIKTLYEKAFQIKYHIEIPETYWEKEFGTEKWGTMTPDERAQAKSKKLQQMDEFLSGSENAYKTFVSFFQIDPQGHEDYGRIKITALEDKTNLNKELITSSAANIEILMAMQVHPALFSSGMIGSGGGGMGAGSGSNIREAFLVYNAGLNLERKVVLEPLRLIADFNREVGGMSEWPEGLEFRTRDTVLTTLDTGSGSKKIVS